MCSLDRQWRSAAWASLALASLCGCNRQEAAPTVRIEGAPSALASEAPATSAALPATPAAFEVVEVDDDAEIVGPDVTAPPSGLDIQTEGGSALPVPRRYVQATRQMDKSLKPEPLESARGRLLSWVEKQSRPAGDRVVLGEISTYDEDERALVATGYRTYLVRGAPILTVADVAEASVATDSLPGAPIVKGAAVIQGASVAIHLRDEAAQRFEAYTASHLRRRVAILVDDRAVAVPVIRTKIAGWLSISMGGGDVGRDLEAAKRLVARLRTK